MLNDVLAERRLYILGEVPRREITVLLGKPERRADNPENYLCSYVILGFDTETVTCTSGVDSLQALQLALKKVAIELALRNASLGGRLRWLSDDDPFLGFSVEETGR